MMSLIALLANSQADPCGMVPPIALSGPTPTLERTGAQRTYVMHRSEQGVGGVETMVLRPGFTGDVEEFGMLIPFPSAPVIRKIDDNTFAQLEAAVDPPEVQVHLYEPYVFAPAVDAAPARFTGSMAEREGAEPPLRLDEVRVVSQEAVGMYEVAVLEAGSPKALERWMADNSYKYPDGMDGVVQDYVDVRWFFVAVKAKVGAAEEANPHPGMRHASTERPEGSSFDGHVQGMGFRFPVDEPVVPMRLSVFNGEDPRNIVYLLSDEPMRIDDVPADLVVRQISGEQVYDNLTELLPVAYHNGKRSQLSKSNQDYVDTIRDPVAFSGVARDLIASDMLATRKARGGDLSLEHEEEEKELLRISESFGLRGAAVDGLHAHELAELRAEAVAGALDDVKEMHLTVLDGVFPQQVLAAQNLTFSPYRMPAKKNVRREDPLRPAAATVSLPKES
ncbi:MAG TPA: DUF2330 domain-containing protein [Myxococcota bacterium]|nr:DUF2330 domain-containing protein [Myxococcota bacterium]